MIPRISSLNVYRMFTYFFLTGRIGIPNVNDGGTIVVYFIYAFFCISDFFFLHWKSFYIIFF